MGGLGGRGGSDAEMVDMNKYAVIWSDINQDLWWQKLTMFAGRDDHKGAINVPTPLQCYMLQQDLWLLEAMFRIIRQVNGNSNANDLSVVKNIDHVVFGREVGGKLGELTPPDPRLAGKADSTGTMSGERGFGGRGMGGMGGLDELDEFDEFDEEDYDEFEDMEEDDSLGGSGRFGALVEGGSGGNVRRGSLRWDVMLIFIRKPLDADVVREVIVGDALPEKQPGIDRGKNVFRFGSR